MIRLRVIVLGVIARAFPSEEEKDWVEVSVKLILLFSVQPSLGLRASPSELVDVPADCAGLASTYHLLSACLLQW